MKILVVEDEPDLLSALVQSLKEAGYAVDSAEDGEEGLFKAAGGGYDAIVLDMMLPRIDGWTLLGTLRKTDTVPVLALTARDAIPDRVRGLDAGADDYLTKPFELTELLARLRASFAARLARPPPRSTWGTCRSIPPLEKYIGPGNSCR